ncbi:MAG: hypothetical protein AAB731_00380, partial [Patescibacteria group bacterium]
MWMALKVFWQELNPRIKSGIIWIALAALYVGMLSLGAWANSSNLMVAGKGRFWGWAAGVVFPETMALATASA